MRRLLAITIAMLLGLTLAVPLFSVNAASNLPACCRRNGSHHCAAGMSESGDKTFSTIAPKCPSFPKATAAPFPHSIAPVSMRDAGTLLYAHPSAKPQTEARYRIAFSRSRQKRGPPTGTLL